MFGSALLLDVKDGAVVQSTCLGMCTLFVAVFLGASVVTVIQEARRSRIKIYAALL